MAEFIGKKIDWREQSLLFYIHIHADINRLMNIYKKEFFNNNIYYMKTIITFNDFVKETKEVEQPVEQNSVISENVESDTENSSDQSSTISDDTQPTEKQTVNTDMGNKHILSFDKFGTGN